ncbi:MAG: hypothetical protein ABIT37_25125 [Luteolibacter sp.]
MKFLHGSEILLPSTRASTLLERDEFLLGCLRRFDVFLGAKMIVVGGEDEEFEEFPICLALHCVIKLEFGDGFVASLRHPTVAPSINADVNVGFVHHFEGDFDSVSITGGEMLHPDGEDASRETGFLDDGTMFFQIQRGAADHRSELAGLSASGGNSRHAGVKQAN